MKFNTGEVIGMKRKLDPLGRVVVPIEYRKELGIKEKDEVEIFLVKDEIFIKVKEK